MRRIDPPTWMPLKTTLAPLLIVSSFAFPPTAEGHGGQYRRLPTVMPPGALGTPRSGGPSAAGTTGARVLWSDWWAYNWDRLIDLKGRLARGRAPQGDAIQRTEKWRPMSGDEKKARLLPALIDALKDKNADVRASAVIALGKLGIEDAVQPLLNATRDRDLIVRNAACMALGFTARAEVQEPMIKLFRSSRTPDTTRAWLALGLGYLGTPEAISELMGIVEGVAKSSTANRELIICSAAGLSVCREPSAGERIAKILTKARKRSQGGQAEAKAMLYVALGKLGTRSALEEIARGMRDDDSIVRAGAVTAAGLLGVSDDEYLVTRLRQSAVDDPIPFVRMLATISMGQIGANDSLAFLRQRLGRNLGDADAFTALALSLARVPSDALKLRKGLAVPHAHTRGAFAIAVGLHGSDENRQAIGRLLQREKNPSTYSDLAMATGLLDVTSTTESLQRTLKREKRGEFRVAAAVALGLLGDADSLDRVLDLLSERLSTPQLESLAFAVTLFGDRSAIDPLVAMLKKSRTQSSVKALCCVALGNIGDSRRYPILSDLSYGHLWKVRTPVLDTVLTLY